MNIKLGKNQYGKNAINLSKLTRHEGGYNEFKQISVNVSLQGDFKTAYTLGDNTKILTTDTQKNTVYVLAKTHFTGSIEAFGIVLADYFFNYNPQVTQTEIEITQHSYARMCFPGDDPNTRSYRADDGKHQTFIVKNSTGTKVTSGIKDLLIVKTTNSGFENFIKDQYTTLKETSDRILATELEANWEYYATDLDYISLFSSIQNTLLKTFAFHKSLSVQHTLYAMGEAVLKEFEQVKEITLIMPNKHHIPFNLEQFDIENNNEIFIATDEPYGYITGTIVRE